MLWDDVATTVDDCDGWDTYEVDRTGVEVLVIRCVLMKDVDGICAVTEDVEVDIEEEGASMAVRFLPTMGVPPRCPGAEMSFS